MPAPSPDRPRPCGRPQPRARLRIWRGPGQRTSARTTTTHRYDRKEAITTTTPDTARLVYTIDEAAAALRISRTKLYELLADGQIESIHIGRSRKIPADALRAYLARLRIPTPRKETS
jgi:excisionase family DNA binding protein